MSQLLLVISESKVMLCCLLVGGKRDNNLSLIDRGVEHCESVWIIPPKLDEQSSGFCWALSVIFADWRCGYTKVRAFESETSDPSSNWIFIYHWKLLAQWVMVLTINPDIPPCNSQGSLGNTAYIYLWPCSMTENLSLVANGIQKKVLAMSKTASQMPFKCAINVVTSQRLGLQGI